MSSSSTSHGVVERVQNWVADNKRVVIVGAVVATVAIGGAAYYASSSRGGDGDRAERKKEKKKAGKSSSKKKKAVNDADGPLLEEISPAGADEVDGESSRTIDRCSDFDTNILAELALTSEQILVMPTEVRNP